MKTLETLNKALTKARYFTVDEVEYRITSYDEKTQVCTFVDDWWESNNKQTISLKELFERDDLTVMTLVQSY